MSMKASTAVIMYGKPVADEIDARLAKAVPRFVEKHKVVPKLAIVQVGHNAASERYIKKKIEACAKLQMAGELKAFPDDISADDLKDEVTKLNHRGDFHGVLVQLPLRARSKNTIPKARTNSTSSTPSRRRKMWTGLAT